MPQSLFTTQKQTLSLTLKNAAGVQVLSPDSAPQWQSSDPTIITVAPTDATGMMAVATATGNPGSANVTATVDGVTGTYAFSVTSNQVASVAINQYGAPSAK